MGGPDAATIAAFLLQEIPSCAQSSFIAFLAARVMRRWQPRRPRPSRLKPIAGTWPTFTRHRRHGTADAEKLDAQFTEFAAARVISATASRASASASTCATTCRSAITGWPCTRAKQLAADTRAPRRSSSTSSADLLGNKLGRSGCVLRPGSAGARQGAHRCDARRGSRAGDLSVPGRQHPARRAAHARCRRRGAARELRPDARRRRQSTYTILANADMPWPTVKLADGRGGRSSTSPPTRSTASRPTATTASA